MKELKEDKRKLEKDIRNLINEFEIKYGTYVKKIELLTNSFENSEGLRKLETIDVIVKIDI